MDVTVQILEIALRNLPSYTLRELTLFVHIVLYAIISK